MNTMGQYGNIWFKIFLLDKGDVISSHSHPFEHVTIVAHGSAMALINEVDSGVFVKGEGCPVDKDVVHGYRALEDGTTLICTMAMHDEDGEIIDWKDALRIPIPIPSAHKVPKQYLDETKKSWAFK